MEKQWALQSGLQMAAQTVDRSVDLKGQRKANHWERQMDSH
jgi:hypothetical protein